MHSSSSARKVKAEAAAKLATQQAAARRPLLMQATKKARRIHVGNLPMNAGVTPAILKTWVDTVMVQLGLVVKEGEPVIDSFVSSDGKFGFVEMRTVAEASNAMAMSGLDFAGRPVRIGRPADYIPITPDVIQQCQGTGILGLPDDTDDSSACDAAAATGVTSGPVAGPDVTNATEVVVIKDMITPAKVCHCILTPLCVCPHGVW